MLEIDDEAFIYHAPVGEGTLYCTVESEGFDFAIEDRTKKGDFPMTPDVALKLALWLIRHNER